MEIRHQHQPSQLLLPLLEQLFILGKQVEGRVILEKLYLVEFSFGFCCVPDAFCIREFYTLFVGLFGRGYHQFFGGAIFHQKVILS